MDQVGDSLKLKKGRLNWKHDGLEKTFLEACIHEIVNDGREGNSLKMRSWKNVAEKLKEEHGFIADQRQMKNRFDYLKGKFNVWTKLHNKTGNVYDPVTKKFNLTKEEWEIEIKLNKYAEPLKNAPLLYPDLCAQLFDGATVTGLDGWGPASTLPHPQEAHDDLEINE
ncbi:L10-interacting MYB domain-containing protein-like [Rutidosis leptorrhynchoides]|uniref:L10-interacting MYB domain-containing protein-like n=1 Tax=Rutidosis leptorrhynchoides TaxID=125765 RepID=UPI003A98CFAE